MRDEPLICYVCGASFWTDDVFVGKGCPLVIYEKRCTGTLCNAKSIEESRLRVWREGHPCVLYEEMKFYVGMKRPHLGYYVRSTHVICVTLDVDAAILYVEFNRMGFYRYRETSKSHFEFLLQAQSIGGHMDYYFKKQPVLHPCEKMTPQGDWVPVKPREKKVNQNG